VSWSGHALPLADGRHIADCPCDGKGKGKTGSKAKAAKKEAAEKKEETK
jgi:hypothetical protein